MKKILLAIDGMKPQASTLDFAIYIAGLSNAKITGLFLENLVADDQFVLQQEKTSAFASWTLDDQSEQYLHKKKIIEQNVNNFKNACGHKALQYSVHLNPDAPAEEVIRESRYADLVIIDARTSFSPDGEDIPSHFAREVLKAAECPVLIAPEKFERIDEIIFAWDGGKSSMFAIKQFCYLFPQLDEQRVKVLSIIGGNSKADDHDAEKFKEWIRGHYSSIGYETKEGDAEIVLFASLFQRKNVLVIMGAYGRTAISQFLRKSRASLLIRANTPALFIAHP